MTPAEKFRAKCEMYPSEPQSIITITHNIVRCQLLAGKYAGTISYRFASHEDEIHTIAHRTVCGEATSCYFSGILSPLNECERPKTEQEFDDMVMRALALVAFS